MIYLSLTSSREMESAPQLEKILCHQALSGFASAHAPHAKKAPVWVPFAYGVGDGSRTHDLQGHNLAL